MTGQPAWARFHAAIRAADPERYRAVPHRLSYGRILERRDQHARFVAWVLPLHQLVPRIPGEPRRCSCGSYAVLCAYLRAAHDLLGQPMPWDGATPAPRDGGDA